ncbi:MAG: isopentenyl-diphosphate Delta-isomerase [Candidatus Micrarchaeia archaeon]
MREKVILVDEKDNEIGTEEKMKAHTNGGKLHRAISIFVFNRNGELMLQQRAFTKYHAKGKWTNTVCTHPRPGESVAAAAHRRLAEEMGFDCDLREVFSFVYTADVGSNLTENEYDHVFFGEYDGEPKPNPAEAASWKWIKLEELKEDVAKNPDNYTPWLRIMLDRVLKQRGL